MINSSFILCIISFINTISYFELAWSHNQTIRLGNFGSVPSNYPAKFSIDVINPSKSNATTYEYRFKFDQFPQHDRTIVSSSTRVSIFVKFVPTCEPISGDFTAQAEVWESQLGVPTHLIGTTSSTFRLRACDWIEIFDDGPVTLDLPITFIIVNRYPTDVPSFEYRIKFDQFPQHDKTIVSTNKNGIEYTVTFESSDTPKADSYTMQVEAWFLGVPPHLITTASHTFKLSDSLVGSINRDQKISYEFLINNFVSTEMPVKLTAEIADPSGFFTERCGIQPANITYKWIINGSPQNESSKVIEPTFSEPQLNNISVIVTATKINGSRLIQKSGTFNISLNSRQPITNLTVDGPTEVKVFERLQLDFEIHGGTPPFKYSYDFAMENPYTWSDRVEKYTNESSFTIINHFTEKGTRRLFIVLSNDVSALGTRVIISVY